MRAPGSPRPAGAPTAVPPPLPPPVLSPWPRLTPAPGLSRSLLSSFSPEESQGSGGAEGAELIYAVGIWLCSTPVPGALLGTPMATTLSTPETTSPPFPPPLGLMSC